MANFYAPGGDFNWSDDWSAADDGIADPALGYPGAGDNAYFSNQSGNCTLDVDVDALNSVLCNIGTGYAGNFAFGAHYLDVDGSCIFGSLGGTITADAGAKIYGAELFLKLKVLGVGTAYPSNLTVELNGTGELHCCGLTGGKLIINTAGTHTAFATDSAGNGLWESFTLTAGTYVDSARPHNIAGTIDARAGTLTSTGTWTMSGSGNLAANTTARRLKELIIGDGVTATMIADVRFLKASTHSGSTLTGDFVFYGFDVDGDNFLDMAGTVNAGVLVYVRLPADRSNNGAIKATTFLLFPDTGTKALTQTGVVTVTETTTIRSGSANSACRLIIGETGCSLRAVTLGTADGTNQCGRLDLGDGQYAVAITSLVQVVTAGDPPSLNEVDFGDAVITLSGALNASSVTCSTTAGNTRPRVEGGTISNVNLSASEYLDARGIGGSCPVDGGGNTNVRFARGLVGGGVF